MIRRLLERLFGLPHEIQQEANVLVVLLGPEEAWLRARDKCQLAEVADAEDARRYWSRVMREIVRQTECEHQPDSATRTAER